MKKQLKEIREIRKQKYLDEFLYQFEKDGVGIPISDIKNPDAFGNEEYGTIVDGSEDTSIEKFAETDYISIYRYEGPAGQRPFCKRLTSLNRLYSREEIEFMNTAYGKANPRGKSYYSVFNYRGGNFCVHRWVRYTYDPTTQEIIRKTFVQPRQVPLR